VSPGGIAPRTRTWIALAGKLLLSAGLMAFLVSRVPLDRLGETLRSADPRWLAGAMGLLFASNLIGSFQWDRLLRVVGVRIPFWKVCAYYHVGLFFNNFLPANIGGDIARVSDATRYGPTRGAAISAVVMDRLIGTVALGGLALVSTLPALDRFHLSLVYLALVGFFAVGVTLVWAVFHPRLLPGLERLLGRIGLRALGPHLDDLAERFRSYRDRRTLFLGLLAVALVIQVARVGVHVLVARALGITVPTAYFFLFVPLLAVIVSLPISLNGIGVREGAGILLFGLVGLDRTHAFSLQFATWLIAVVISLLGGLVLLARIPRRAIQARNLRRSS
jgi:uncharacterized protein (TIRG00374 family)